jgi:hypothetical protein
VHSNVCFHLLPCMRARVRPWRSGARIERYLVQLLFRASVHLCVSWPRSAQRGEMPNEPSGGVPKKPQRELGGMWERVRCISEGGKEALRLPETSPRHTSGRRTSASAQRTPAHLGGTVVGLKVEY